MDLAAIWFALIGLTFVIYFFLDGFDFGAGLLQPFIARNERERRAVLGTVGPFWAANEVWIILGAGAIFAAFPLWYGTLMTALYPLFTLILLALIGRGVAFEYRAEVDNVRWRQFWDVTAFVCNLLPAFLWGMIMANMVRGLPIDSEARFQGGLSAAFSLFTLLGGLATLSLFVLHGATFLLLRLKADTDLHARARAAALSFGGLATVLVLAFVLIGFVQEGRFNALGLSAWLFPAGAALNLALVWLALTLRRDTLAFLATGLTIVFSTATIFVSLFPAVLPSTLNPAFTLTVQGSASEPYTLRALSWAAGVFLPLILAYQGWNFWVFRNRVTGHDTADEGELVYGQHGGQDGIPGDPGAIDPSAGRPGDPDGPPAARQS
ncbi:cytochrome d ubiquinol oxidase subunit II [Deinococcus knuensis]|uniref:Cytochrome c oxidase assembly protein n=1 Tax=Deinococcus knuensis TaxID=1837380 RepID=A0ABQ2SD75_9DEIO|nr:cytochrome d ubiquinol oxidase subunit II [Deinococcus knuensis]GGS22081.1 cytochrome c oxidase assembly protein [Deinococcus knuensis]